MKTAKLSTLYFLLSAGFAVGAACASPCLLLQRHPQAAHTAALGDTLLPMDAQIALAR